MSITSNSVKELINFFSERSQIANMKKIRESAEKSNLSEQDIESLMDMYKRNRSITKKNIGLTAVP